MPIYGIKKNLKEFKGKVRGSKEKEK